MSNDLLFKIALSKIPGVGAKLGKHLIAYCGGIEPIFTESLRRLHKIPGIGEKLANEISKVNPYELAEQDILYHERKNNKITFFLDEDYPLRLRHIEDAPILFYSKGNYNPHPSRTVSIVGTRKPSPYGQAICESLVNDLKPFDVQIISGLAYGIDAIAHKTANRCDIENVAIMGTGLDVIYPSVHHKLSEQIQKNGALISEYPIKMRADKENFPRRNRVIAGLADVVVVIQSASKGGSLITAEFGNQYHKDVFAFPGRVTDDTSTGCNALIKQNKAHLIESVKDIAYIMRWEKDAQAENDKQASLFIELSDEEKSIMGLLKHNEEAPIDWLHHKSEKNLSELANILLSLEFKGLVLSLPGKKYTLS